MKRFTPLLLCLVLAAAIAGGAYVWMNGVALPETVTPAAFEPVGGAIADRAVMQTRAQSAQMISTTLPVLTSVAELPMGIFLMPGKDDHGHDEHGMATDADLGYEFGTATKAVLYKFENSEICYDGLCPIGLYPVLENGSIDFEASFFIMHAADIAISDRMTNGNPELIVDYGVRGGKRRFVWSDGELYPSYADMGPLN